MKSFTIIIASPNYLIAVGYPAQFKVTVNAHTEEEAHAKAFTKFNRMLEILKINNAINCKLVVEKLQAI